jgi:hypothetical protein
VATSAAHARLFIVLVRPRILHEPNNLASERRKVACMSRRVYDGRHRPRKTPEVFLMMVVNLPSDFFSILANPPISSACGRKKASVRCEGSAAGKMRESGAVRAKGAVSLPYLAPPAHPDVIRRSWYSAYLYRN